MPVTRIRDMYFHLVGSYRWKHLMTEWVNDHFLIKNKKNRAYTLVIKILRGSVVRLRLGYMINVVYKQQVTTADDERLIN